MLVSKVLGVIVIARNGDRYRYYQDPGTYAGSITETTALGVAESHQLGSLLRSLYLTPSSASYINDISFDLVDTREVTARLKAGVEGDVVFDSATALLQGLFPPNLNNNIELANGTTVVAPLGGYQYIPVETVEPGNDRSFESWTNCAAFEKHTKEFYASDKFKNQEKEAQPFFQAVKDYVFGRPTTLQNAWNIYDFINTELVHNKTYAYRLPPTLINQARSLADWHESGVFSDKDIAGIGNIAGRTLMHSIINSLERIVFDKDPHKFLLIQTTYQPFISFFHMTGIAQDHPELRGIPDYSSAIVIELRRGNLPDFRDFLRVKFRNGTQTRRFVDLPVFGHGGDIPLTEFIYRAEHAAITSDAQWKEVCNGNAVNVKPFNLLFFNGADGRGVVMGVASFFGLLALFVAVKFVRRYRERAREARIRISGGEDFRDKVPVDVGEKARLV